MHGNFQALVVGRVVACRHIDASDGTFLPDGMRNDWSGCIALAHEGLKTVFSQHLSNRTGELRPHETRVVAQYDLGLTPVDRGFFPLELTLEVGGNGLGYQGDVGEGKILGNDASPSGSSESNAIHE